MTRWHAALLLGTLAVPLLWRDLLHWPWYQLMPLLLYAIVVSIVPQLRSTQPLRVGAVEPGLVVLGSALAGVVLVGWAHFTKPDLADVRALIPIDHIWIAACLFASLNAMMEELIWRGVLQEGLRTSLGDRGAVLVQGIAFGWLHRTGVPRGAWGQALASMFGVSQGWLRLRTWGLVTPLLIHVAVDAVIFWLVWRPPG